MHSMQTLKLGLAFAGLCVLGTAAHPAEAQIPGQLERFTLSGVTFADGATASGSFIYNGALVGTNPATPVSVINITTTKGVIDSVAGNQYGDYGYYLDDPGRYEGRDNGFVLNNLGFQGQQSGQLFLIAATGINFNSSGAIIPLIPGYNNPNFLNPASGSSETTSGTRQIVSGFLIETPAAVPEASTTISFGLLLVLGVGGVIVAARQKKSAV